MHRVIRPPEAVGQRCLARADDVPAQRLTGRRHERLERGAQLVFRCPGDDLRRLGRYGVGEVLQGRVEKG